MLAAWLTHHYFAVDSYNWWYISLFPAMTALVCGIVINKDRKLKERAVAVLPVDLRKVWDGKVLYGICGIGISLLVLFAVSIIGGTLMKSLMHITFIIEPTVKVQLGAVLVLFLSCLWQVPFCMILTDKIGMLPTMLVHAMLCTLQAISVALKPYFLLFPGALASRMMCAVLHVLPNGLPADPGMITFSTELLDMKSVWLGIPASVGWFLLFWFVGRVLYRRKGRG